MREADSRPALNAEQIEFFKSQGYLVLENFVSEEVVGGWQRDICEFFGLTAQPDGTWHRGHSKGSVDDFPFCSEPGPNRLPQMTRVVEQLGGGTFRGGAEQLIIRWPQPGNRWCPPQKGHIDTLPKSTAWRFMLGTAAYGFEVVSRGGGFFLWPGSHLLTWQYFQSHPDHLHGEVPGGLDWVQDRLLERMPGAPVEFVAKPGTVLLWHSFLLHNGSPNSTCIPRVGIFGRWGQAQAPGEPRETFGEIWEHWAI